MKGDPIMTVNKLLKQEEIVKPILEQHPETRGDDFLLYAEVIREYRPELAELSVLDFFVAHSNLYCPSYNSITRVRRRLQRKYPELLSEKAKEKRAKEEAIYREYAKGKQDAV